MTMSRIFWKLMGRLNRNPGKSEMRRRTPPPDIVRKSGPSRTDAAPRFHQDFPNQHYLNRIPYCDGDEIRQESTSDCMFPVSQLLQDLQGRRTFQGRRGQSRAAGTGLLWILHSGILQKLQKVGLPEVVRPLMRLHRYRVSLTDSPGTAVPETAAPVTFPFLIP